MAETQLNPSRVPLPASVSEQARQYLSAASPYGDLEPPTDLFDVKAWLRYVETRDHVIAERLGQALPADLPVDRAAFQLDGVTTYVIRPSYVPDVRDTPVYLDIHGGALILGGGELCRLMATGGALSRSMITWAVDYRMPPLHPYPAALDDCTAVYRRALEERLAREYLLFGGGSAGGNPRQH